MDYLEKKSNKLLNKLSELQVKQCCRHIDYQISKWYRSQVAQPQVVPTVTPPIALPTDVIVEPHEESIQPDDQPTDIITESLPIDVNILSPTALESPPQPQQTIEIKSEPQVESSQLSTSDQTLSQTESQPQLESKSESQPQLQLEKYQQQSQLQIQTQLQPPQPSIQPLHIHQQPQSKVDTNSPDRVTTNAIGHFLSNIKHLESFDSDATESLSSNDSYDELEGFSLEDIPPKHPPLPFNQPHTSDLKKKAIWKWANERSKLASRWTWLQAQVTELEFRIRGQNEALAAAKNAKTPIISTLAPEHSSSRAAPLSKDFQRRRLIRAQPVLADSNKRLVKYSHVPCVCNSLPQTVGPCISCNGRYNYIRQMEAENVSMSERISLLDPCCHPVLSLPDDVTLGSQLSYLLKQETMNRRPTKGRPGRKKGSTAASLAAAAAAAAANGESSGNKHKGKSYRGIVGRPPGSTAGLKNSSNAMMSASNKLRRKYMKQHSNNTANNYDGWQNSNNHNLHHNSTRRNKRIKRASSMNDGSNCSETSNQYRPNHYANNNNSNSAQNVGSRRRRSEQSAYDIDNIVIPFSIAATTRVEILEYKEIMTPSWRVWENGTCQTDIKKDNDDDETEDISDEAYITRHSKGESEEKKRFSLKPPPNVIKNKSEQ